MIYINMFGQTIEAGYVIEITSWENDGDYTQSNVLTGLTKKEVEFYSEWLKSYGPFAGINSPLMGNEDFNFVKAMTHLHSFREKYMHEIESCLDIDLYDVDSIELALQDKEFCEYNYDMLYDAICGLLGKPVRYDYGFVRVYDGIRVYELSDKIVLPKLKRVKI